MTLFTESVLSRLGKSTLAKSSYYTADRMLKLDEIKASSTNTFDIFLSHSIKDADVILGIKALLTQQGFSVYVDWIVDNSLDRNKVTTSTADLLRTRMKQSKSLIYAHSNSSPDSKWMPWELGFFDGYSGVVAVFPTAKSIDEKFQGQEFLGLYPYIDTINDNTSIFVNKGNAPERALGSPDKTKTFLFLKEWMQIRTGVKAAA